MWNCKLFISFHLEQNKITKVHAHNYSKGCTTVTRENNRHL